MLAKSYVHQIPVILVTFSFYIIWRKFDHTKKIKIEEKLKFVFIFSLHTVIVEI